MLVVFMSCGNDEEEFYEPELNIYCLLQAGAWSQRVIVDRSYCMDETTGSYIADAQVILSGPGFVDTFAFSDYDSIYYATNPSLTISPESTYYLTVAKQGFDTVFAQTCVPGDFYIQFPESWDTLLRTDTLVWTKSPGAQYYYGYFIDVNGYSRPFWHIPDTTDTQIYMSIPYHLYDLPSGYYWIEIQAGDVNYLNYSQFNENTDSLLQAGVEGGIGVFGSFVSRSRYVFFLTE